MTKLFDNKPGILWLLATGLAIACVVGAAAWHIRSTDAGVQAEAGSVLIAVYSADEIAMAADSRVTNVKTGVFSDDYCKLAARGGRALFGTTGLVESIGGFDSAALFRRVAGELASNPRKGFVEQIAARWADQMDQNYAKMPPNLIHAFMGENSGARALDCSLFAGIDSSGDLSLARARLFYGAAGNPADVRYKIEVIPLASATPGYIQIAGCGNIDVLKSFTPPKTPAAQAEVDSWKRFTRDPPAQIARRLVSLTIAREGKERFGGREVVPVGGAVDEAEARRGDSVKWLSLKRGCPVN